MKIKLICPKSSVRPMDSAWKTQMSPPLPLLVLGALTPPRHEVSLADENVERLHLDDHPDLVGLTVKVDTLYRAADIARKYRRRGIPVVMGGIHATARPADCMPISDSVVIGEAELLWPQVLEDAARGRLRHASTFGRSFPGMRAERACDRHAADKSSACRTGRCLFL